MIFTQEAPLTRRWFSGRSCIRSNWNLGVNFEEGGNRSARRKPSKSGWDRLKLNPHTTFVVEVEGVIDVHYASLTSLNLDGLCAVGKLTAEPCNRVQCHILSIYSSIFWAEVRRQQCQIYIAERSSNKRMSRCRLSIASASYECVVTYKTGTLKKWGWTLSILISAGIKTSYYIT